MVITNLVQPLRFSAMGDDRKTSILEFSSVCADGRDRQCRSNKLSDKKDGDVVVEILGLGKSVWVEKLRILNSVAQQLKDPPNACTARERAWLKWFDSLSKDDQEIVEIIGARGISVRPTNFDQMKKLVKSHDAEDSGSHE